MKENQFNTEVKNSLKKHGAWAYKIADQPTSWTASKTRFTPEKPCDIVAIHEGVGMLIEGKQFKKFEAFGLRHLRPSQVKNMDEAVDKNNRAFVFLNIRIKAIAGRQRRDNRLIIFDWKIWRERIKEASIKHKEVRELPYIKGSRGGYDLTEFIKDLHE